MLSVIVYENSRIVGRIDLVRQNKEPNPPVGHYKATVYDRETPVSRREFIVENFTRADGFWKLAEIACTKARDGGPT